MLNLRGSGVYPEEVALVGNDAPQLDHGRVAGHPGGGPGGVVNAVALQRGGENGAEVLLREDIPVVIVCGQLDVVLL